MSEASGGASPFGSFPQGGMMDNMWDMMKLNPFAGAMPGSGGPSLSMMSDMLAPLTNVEELDKRITDMRAVEQWLKLNLNMLQSAIQALEVQRATLATLRAFGAFAKDSMDRAAAGAEPALAERAAASPFSSGWPMGGSSAASEPAGDAEGSASAATASEPAPEGVSDPAFDPSGWWNMLQSQFNNLATLAMAQAAVGTSSDSGDGARAGNAAEDGRPAAKRPAARKGPARKAAARKKPN
jgi:hypothetical protein